MMYDAIVCGAGPAGSVVARRLAAAGARVALVGMGSRPGWEGLSARSSALLTEEGLDAQSGVVAGPFVRRGAWAEGRIVEGTEWLVERSRLAAALRSRALSEGAALRTDTVTGTRREAHLWRVYSRSGDVLRAPVLIEARGRRGAQRRGPVLLAYGQRFHGQWRASSETGIGASDRGWCWWAQHGEALWVQVVGRPRAGPPAQWIAVAAAQIPALARALDGASAQGDPVARPAHARLGAIGRDPTLWQVGDAALALDPLSGQGVYEALRGARLAATVIQSIMEGGDALLAQRFVAERRDAAWRHGVRVAASFYGENAARGEFWSDVAAEYAALLSAGRSAPRAGASLDGAASDGAALATEAFTESAAAVGVAAMRIERRPVLDRGRILEHAVIVTAEHPRGLWHVDGVPLVALKTYLDAAEHATIAGAAELLDRPQSAVTSAVRWLQKTGAVLRQVSPSLSLGG